jgi:hypothetical protein
MNLINVAFDFRLDSFGKDPDSHSATLKNYHKILWSKPLPNGDALQLQDDLKGSYLYHQSPKNLIHLSSDSIIHSYKNAVKIQSLLKQIDPAEVEDFRNLGYTIGGFILFPSNRIKGKMSINGARGFNSKIVDRFDLTLECIRRHYAKDVSPLSEVLDRYKDFFSLFINFEGYVNFFLLDDLVDSDSQEINYFVPDVEPFSTSPFPQNIDQYQVYKLRSMDFLSKRNARIAAC